MTDFVERRGHARAARHRGRDRQDYVYQAATVAAVILLLLSAAL